LFFFYFFFVLPRTNYFGLHYNCDRLYLLEIGTHISKTLVQVLIISKISVLMLLFLDKRAPNAISDMRA
jgi:hypothetical protein